jgi:hypothetical protein
MCCALCIHALCGPWVMQSMGQYPRGMWIAAVDPAICCPFRISQCMDRLKQDPRQLSACPMGIASARIKYAISDKFCEKGFFKQVFKYTNLDVLCPGRFVIWTFSKMDIL